MMVIHQDTRPFVYGIIESVSVVICLSADRHEVQTGYLL